MLTNQLLFLDIFAALDFLLYTHTGISSFAEQQIVTEGLNRQTNNTYIWIRVKIYLPLFNIISSPVLLNLWGNKIDMPVSHPKVHWHLITPSQMEVAPQCIQCYLRMDISINISNNEL